MTTITETDPLQGLLENMNPAQAEEFQHKRKSTANAVELAESILRRDKANIQEAIYNSTPMSAADHRTKATALQATADELKAGEKKDAYQKAADDHNKAGDCIDAAHKSSAKANLLD